MSSNDPPPSYWRPAIELMLEEARRGVDHQSEDLSNLRARAGTILGTAGAIAALFLSLRSNEPVAYGWVASAFFLLLVGCVTLVLLPRRLNVDMDIHEMADLLTAGPESVEQSIENLATAHWDNYLSNRKILDRLHTAMFTAATAMAMEVLALALGIVVS
jgi:hypothetical protein